MFKVIIKSWEDDNIVKTIECDNKREADHVERGININLNHDEYHTEIVGE